MFENHLNPVMLIFIGKDIPGHSDENPCARFFFSFFRFFASFCIGQISHQQHKGKHVTGNHASAFTPRCPFHIHLVGIAAPQDSDRRTPGCLHLIGQKLLRSQNTK